VTDEGGTAGGVAADCGRDCAWAVGGGPLAGTDFVAGTSVETGATVKVAEDGAGSSGRFGTSAVACWGGTILAAVRRGFSASGRFFGGAFGSGGVGGGVGLGGAAKAAGAGWGLGVVGGAI
jgi:hypothetical protein